MRCVWQHCANGFIRFQEANHFLSMGLEVPLGANGPDVAATGHGAVVLQLAERVEL